MHILLGILGVIGSILTSCSGALKWPRKQRARDIASSAKDAKNYLRRRRWEKKANADPIKDMNDPREAAATMMAALASYDGAMSEREETVILDEIGKAISTLTENSPQNCWRMAAGCQRMLAISTAFFAKLLPPINRDTSAPRNITDLHHHAGKCRQRQWSEASDLEKDAILFVKRHLSI